MASLTKHPKSQFWVACFRSRDGRQLKRSTKTTDRAEAMRIAQELEGAESGAKRNSIQPRRSEPEPPPSTDPVVPVDPGQVTVAGYLDEWLATVKTRNSAATLQRYRTTVQRFKDSLGASSAGSCGRSECDPDDASFVNVA